MNGCNSILCKKEKKKPESMRGKVDSGLFFNINIKKKESRPFIPAYEKEKDF